MPRAKKKEVPSPEGYYIVWYDGFGRDHFHRNEKWESRFVPREVAMKEANKLARGEVTSVEVWCRKDGTDERVHLIKK
jgi:hypothetical protein